MTNGVKRILGLIGFLLGLPGMVLCIAVIVGAWWINGPLTEGLLQAFPPIEAALDFGDATAERFGVFVGDTQTQFNETAEAKPVATELADEIEQVAIYVNMASGLASSAEKTISDMSNAVQPGVRSSNVASRAAGQMATTMDTVNTSLNSAEMLAQDVRDGRTEQLDQLNDQLDMLAGNSAEVQTAISQTSDDLAELKLKIPRWINLGSLIVTLIFLWFGIAQYFLMRNSWNWLRRPQIASQDFNLSPGNQLPG